MRAHTHTHALSLHAVSLPLKYTLYLTLSHMLTHTSSFSLLHTHTHPHTYLWMCVHRPDTLILCMQHNSVCVCKCKWNSSFWYLSIVLSLCHVTVGHALCSMNYYYFSWIVKNLLLKIRIDPHFLLFTFHCSGIE